MLIAAFSFRYMASSIHCHAVRTVDELVTHVTQERFAFAHAWQEGDCLIWDNRCTLHTPSHLDADAKRRLMWRITIWGDQITPKPAALKARLDAGSGGYTEKS